MKDSFKVIKSLEAVVSSRPGYSHEEADDTIPQ